MSIAKVRTTRNIMRTTCFRTLPRWSKRRSRVSTFAVAHQPATECQTACAVLVVRRPDSGMSGPGAEIKRHERLLIDTSDHEFVHLRRPASEARCTAVRLRLASAAPFDAVRLQPRGARVPRRAILNPAILVTPTVRCPVLVCVRTPNQHVVSKTERRRTPEG